MIIYEVSAQVLTCDGNFSHNEVIKRYMQKIHAEAFKNWWENLWQTHTDNHECVSPCWFDYRKELTINPVEVEENFGI